MSTLCPTGQIPNSTCPKCGAELTVITKRKITPYMKHPQFVGCTGYPRCNYTKIVTDEIRAVMEQVKAERDLMPAEF